MCDLENDLCVAGVGRFLPVDVPSMRGIPTESGISQFQTDLFSGFKASVERYKWLAPQIALPSHAFRCVRS
jgi:hypothetical protein